ncbi:hypothetical protein C5Y96_22645 [Blastopirellula marina]|uniref:Uncharacterized protein n=1 Tax=Blastopirellula marina TaxID=124 RepID=A0A2S8F121_9BACT|nr:hypothetical protein C5Y96_22645 [Blastopirellula marina]RCS43307.1 hypothetical protein DTL36_22695 [Bremerella cremea]
MTWIFGGWFLSGIILGAVHAMGLRNATSHTSPYAPLLGILRLFAVGISFFFSAILGGIFPLAFGWGLGFFVVVGIVTRIQDRDHLQQEVAP